MPDVLDEPTRRAGEIILVASLIGTELSHETVVRYAFGTDALNDRPEAEWIRLARQFTHNLGALHEPLRTHDYQKAAKLLGCEALIDLFV